MKQQQQQQHIYLFMLINLKKLENDYDAAVFI